MRLKTLPDTPHTISYVIRKRQQLDSLYELPKEKQPPADMIWDGVPEDIDEWIGRVFDKNYKENVDLMITEVEG